MSVVGLCFRLCSLLQYLRTITKFLESRVPEIKEASAEPSSAAEEGDLTVDLHEDKNNRREAPTPVSPASDATATGSDGYYFAGYLNKEIDNQR